LPRQWPDLAHGVIPSPAMLPETDCWNPALDACHNSMRRTIFPKSLKVVLMDRLGFA